MASERLSTVAHVRGLLEVTSLVRGEDDLDAVLAAIARTIGESLGYGTVAVNLYRPAWDDFLVTTVHGNDGAREALLGDARDLASWRPLLNDRFLRRGAYFIPHEEHVWRDDVAYFVPDLEPHDDPDAWHPEDALLVPMRRSDGELAGILSVDEPSSGARPSDDELDVLVAVAEHAALAVESAQEAAEAARHRAALEHLLRVSSRLAESLTPEDILQAVCESIRDALGFGNVAIELVGAEGRLEALAAVGWQLGDETLSAPITLSDVEPLFDPAFEVEGCFLLPCEEGHRRFGGDVYVYASTRNGRGPHAWNRHWLVVPLEDPDGSPFGVIWADEPEDRLVPRRDRLQALRLFANQATTALALAGQVEELRFLADHDPLTRLLNRRAFIARLDGEVARSTRSGTPFGLVLADLDGFKALNDRHGHLAGDQALRLVARILGDALRRSDDVFRIGGDEFALLLPDASATAAAEIVARVARALEATPEPELVGLRASFGVASFPEQATTPEALFRVADESLYAAKRARAAAAL